MMKHTRTKKDEDVLDDYFGMKIADPYRWLEDDRSKETAEWVKAQNKVTAEYLETIPFRGELKKRLAELYNYPKYGIPFMCGEYLFFFKNDGLQNQAVLYRQKGESGTPEVFIDPNLLSGRGTAALTSVTCSKDGRHMAFSVSEAGSDWTEIRVMDTGTRRLLDDEIKWVKFSEAVWCGDGFYYSRYDEPSAEKQFTGTNEFQKIYFHRLNTPQADDILILEDPSNPLRYFRSRVSEDGRHIFIHCSEGTSGDRILYKKRASTEGFKVLFEGFVNDYEIIHCDNGKAVIYTNDRAGNFHLLRADLTDETPEIQVLVPETADKLESATVCGEYMFLTYLHKASSRMLQYGLNGIFIREVYLPGLGTAAGFRGRKEDKITYFSFTSYNYPPSVFRFDCETGQTTLHCKSDMGFIPDDYVVEQRFFTSKDGTEVPMFITYKKGIGKDGNNPVHLYGYGGFNISLTPAFNPMELAFIEQGGIYGVVNLRGGGEFGENWHKAGMLANKQNVFDDFISAAEWLISEKYTSKNRLAISGGSNGGLLVGACLTQRPDLFAAVVPRVGVLDMLRYHKFTVGWGWVVEYGSSDDRDQCRYLYKYSPLHNLKNGTRYPPTLIMTADHDDRVVPAHSFKFAAALQEAQGCGSPVVIRVDTDAGHGAGKPVSKLIDEMTDMYSFIMYHTGMTPSY